MEHPGLRAATAKARKPKGLLDKRSRHSEKPSHQDKGPLPLTATGEAQHATMKTKHRQK